MKGKVITNNPAGDFYVVEEMDYQDKKYILCHSLEEEPKSETEINLALFEVKIKDNELIIDNVEDETAQIVTTMIMEKINQNN